MKIVAISDTHMQIHKIASSLEKVEADLLLHGGDFTYRGTLNEVAQELYNLGKITERFKYGGVIVAGNHDWLAELEPSTFRMIAEENGLIWLQNQETTVNGIRIYGSGSTPEFCGWALNLDRNDGSLEREWDKIPEGIDILVTHGPSFGRQDHSYDAGPLGCTKLMQAIDRVKPSLHIFGHIHHAYGHHIGADGILYVNASICNEQYDSNNKPIVVEYTPGLVGTRGSAIVIDS